MKGCSDKQVCERACDERFLSNDTQILGHITLHSQAPFYRSPQREMYQDTSGDGVHFLVDSGNSDLLAE